MLRSLTFLALALVLAIAAVVLLLKLFGERLLVAALKTPFKAKGATLRNATAEFTPSTRHPTYRGHATGTRTSTIPARGSTTGWT